MLSREIFPVFEGTGNCFQKFMPIFISFRIYVVWKNILNFSSDQPSSELELVLCSSYQKNQPCNVSAELGGAAGVHPQSEEVRGGWQPDRGPGGVRRGGHRPEQRKNSTGGHKWKRWNSTEFHARDSTNTFQFAGNPYILAVHFLCIVLDVYVLNNSRKLCTYLWRPFPNFTFIYLICLDVS